jgi:hypothetical protein
MITLRVDIFKILNSHAVEDRWEIGDADHADGPPETFTPDVNYGLPRLYQAPRSVRFGMDINF